MKRLRRWFWSTWDGRLGTIAMSTAAGLALFVLGKELYDYFRLAFGALFGIGVGWRFRRHFDADMERHRTTRIDRVVANIRRFVVGNGEKH